MDLDSGQLIYFGGEVKSLDDSGRVGGPLVIFSTAADPDTTGDYFTPETDFGRHYKGGLGMYYIHGLPKHNGKPNPLEGREIGDAEISLTDSNVWMEGQLKLRDDYEKEVWRSIKSRKLHYGLSSGAAQHLVRRVRKPNGAHFVKTWPLIEASITPTPAEPRTYVNALKSLEWLIDTGTPDHELKDYGDPGMDMPGMGDEAMRRALCGLFDSAESRVMMALANPRKAPADKVAMTQDITDELNLTVAKLINVFLKEPSDATAAEMKSLVDTFGDGGRGFPSLVERLQTCAGTASGLAQVVGRWTDISTVKLEAVKGLRESFGQLHEGLGGLLKARANWVDPAEMEAKRRTIEAMLAKLGAD